MPVKYTEANFCLTVDLNVSGQIFIAPQDMAAMNLALIPELKEAENQVRPASHIHFWGNSKPFYSTSDIYLVIIASQ